MILMRLLRNGAAAAFCRQASVPVEIELSGNREKVSATLTARKREL